MKTGRDATSARSTFVAGADLASRSDVPTISPAQPSDRMAIAALLRAAELPDEDFAEHIRHFLVARRAGTVVGAIGAEVCGGDALLRSFVVATEDRGAGLGGQLLNELERAGEAWGVQRWWLLTTTAESFFTRRGFHRVARADAPAAIASTVEFRELCPSIASCLTRERRSS